MASVQSHASTSGGDLESGNLTPIALVKDLQKTHQETLQVIQLILKVFKVLADLMSYPTLILFRCRLGERVLSGSAFLLTWFLTSLVALASGTSLGYVFILGLPLMYGLHRLGVKSRNRQGIRHYSFCRGDSWFDLVLPRHESFNRGVLEPAVLLIAAFTLQLYGQGLILPPEMGGFRTESVGPWILSAYLAAMGLSLFFVEARLRQQQRHTLLDHIDQQIIGTYFSSELNEQTEVADEGFAVAELADWSPRQKHSLAANLGLPVFRRDPEHDNSASDSLWNTILDPLPSAPGMNSGITPAPGIAPGS